MTTYTAILQQIIVIAAPQIRAIEAKRMNEKPSPEKWSKKQILGHLIDSAYNNHQRIIRAKSQGNLVFLGYDPGNWVIQNDYQNRSLDDVLNTFVTVHHHLGVVISTVPEKVLNQETTNHNFHQISMNRVKENSTSTLSYLIWDYIFHLEHHLAQIIPNYKKLNRAEF